MARSCKFVPTRMYLHAGKHQMCELMKNNSSFLKLTTLAAFTLIAFAGILEAQIYEYDWIGGQPGFSGKLFLDAPSSASAPHGGNVADVLPGSYLTTPIGSYTIFDFTYSSSYFSTVSWDQSHVSLAMLFFQSTTTIYDPYFGLPSEGETQVGVLGVTSGIQIIIRESNGGFATQTHEDDYSGRWLAVPVPEPATFAFAAIAVAALIVFRIMLCWSGRCRLIPCRSMKLKSDK